MTRVMTKGELGGPMERLREQVEKLQLCSSQAGMLGQQLGMAEKRVKRLDGEKQAPEASAAAKHGGSDPRIHVSMKTYEKTNNE